jgi:hypothetical protein
MYFVAACQLGTSFQLAFSKLGFLYSWPLFKLVLLFSWALFSARSSFCQAFFNAGLFQPGLWLWIRIDLMRIRIQHFSESRVLMTAEKNLILF